MIAIKEMDMPANCAECEIRWLDSDEGNVCPLVMIADEWWNYDGPYKINRHPKCPLTEIKEYEEK